MEGEKARDRERKRETETDKERQREINRDTDREAEREGGERTGCNRLVEVLLPEGGVRVETYHISSTLMNT